MSAALAAMLRKSTDHYKDRWVEKSELDFATAARAEVVTEHLVYWDAIVRAVESAEFEELLNYSREAGRFQCRSGFDLSDAIKRTVNATNLIEVALLEANDGEVPPITIVNEIGDLRSIIAMAVAEGYKLETDSQTDIAAALSMRERLRASLLRQRTRYTTYTLPPGDEILPLYDAGMRFYFVESGKLRLYNLLPNGRTITLSILGENDVFLQWRAESASLSCLCAEAMTPSSVLGVSEADLVDLIGAQPAAAIDVIAAFTRRITESQVLIEDLLNNSVNVRLYRTLLELAKQFGKVENSATLIDIPLTHQRLADMIGSNRVTVTRKLHELQDRGVIESRRNSTIAVKQIDLLSTLAASEEA
jgi:CRP/FNR family cyclic AMP-dependent transcriptional regulator